MGTENREQNRPAENWAQTGRDEKGRFVPGNKGGGRKPIPKELRDILTLKYGPEAIHKMYALMTDPQTPKKIQLEAAEALADRAFGGPTQAVEMAGDGGGPLQIVVLPPAGAVRDSE